MNLLSTAIEYRRVRVHVDGSELVIEWVDLVYGQEPVIKRLTITGP